MYVCTLCVQESEGAQPSVPSDLYDYLEKMDRDEEETEEEVRERGGGRKRRGERE